MDTRPNIILGAGGQAKMALDILQQANMTVIGCAALTAPEHGPLSEILYLGDDSTVLNHSPEDVLLVNAIGSVKSTQTRRQVFDHFHGRGYQFANLFHVTSHMSNLDVVYGEGLQLMPRACINTGSRIEQNVLINTAAVVEHDCTVGEHTHVASGVVVCGGCRIGNGVHVGANATINQDISIGDGAVIASGAVVIHDVSPNCLVAGVPAIVKRTNVE